jgi:enamine deaminase RidA (YjgF/YER057c/UK114 family)
VERRIVNPWTWQDQFGYVQANETSGVERILHCAGQTSVDADGQPLHVGDMGAQVGQALDNLETVLSEAGFALADVVRLNYYVTDVDASSKRARSTAQSSPRPAAGPRRRCSGCRGSRSRRCSSRSRRPLCSSRR